MPPATTYEPPIVRLRRRLTAAGSAHPGSADLQSAPSPKREAPNCSQDRANPILPTLRQIAREQGDPWVSLTVLHRELALAGHPLSPVAFVAAITALDRNGHLYLNPINELPPEGFVAGTITARNSAGQTCLEASAAAASAEPGSADFQSAPSPKREAPESNTNDLQSDPAPCRFPPAPTRDGRLDYPPAPTRRDLNPHVLLKAAASTLQTLSRHSA